jgi:hypothetical protein
MSVEDITDYHKVNDSEPIIMAVEPEYRSNMEAYSSDGEEEVETSQENRDEFD